MDIRTFRKEKKMIQKIFAQKCNISVKALSAAEHNNMSLTTALRICNAYPDELVIKNMWIEKRTEGGKK
jgi:DNA-binding XRE family transcriptional regulator